MLRPYPPSPLDRQLLHGRDLRYRPGAGARDQVGVDRDAARTLGLEDGIIGTAFPDGPAADEWATAAEGIPADSGKVPGLEATLRLEPDLVYAARHADRVIVFSE